MNTAIAGDRVLVQLVAFQVPRLRGQRAQRTSVEFTVGSGEVIPGISLGVVGMAVGEQKRLVLQPQDAYGDVRQNLISEVPRKRFPQHLKLHAGKRLSAVNAAGRRRRIRIVQLKRTSVVVDANHPLAGKVLEVEIRLLALRPSRANQEKLPFDLGGEG
jgi:peptidylprolyl isomerase